MRVRRVDIVTGIVSGKPGGIRPRTGEGRTRAVARGVKMGRPPKLTPRQGQRIFMPSPKVAERVRLDIRAQEHTKRQKKQNNRWHVTSAGR